MKTLPIIAAAVCSLFTAFNPVFAQGTAFTYQGLLSGSNSPVTGSFDLTFTVYDSSNLPVNIIAGPKTNSATSVSNGLFTVVLDFGAGAFNGSARWLEIGVRTNGSGLFSVLAPRQQLTATPYAIFANTASNLVGNIPAAQVTGAVLSIGANAPLSVTSGQNPVVSLSGNITVPVGTQASLPSTPAVGQIFYNTTTKSLMVNDGNSWQSFSSPAGCVTAYMGTTAPAGWLLCDGSAVGRSGPYGALFAVIGTACGSGDGSTTFNLPDMRGMFLRGVSGTSSQDPDKTSRTAANTGGNTGNAVGSVQGDQFAAHSHSLNQPGVASITGSGSTSGVYTGTGTSVGTIANGDSVNASGGSETRPRNVYVNYIIKY